jgi:hypothetical protein
MSKAFASAPDGAMPAPNQTSNLPVSPEGLSWFVAQCLEPPPNGIPPDQEFNRLSRKARQEAFNLAESRMQVARAALELLDKTHALEIQQRGAFLISKFDNLRTWTLREWRRLYADLIRTPAHDRASLAWKKKAISASSFEYFPVSAQEAADCIAADEAFLDAHPVRRSRKQLIEESAAYWNAQKAGDAA